MNEEAHLNEGTVLLESRNRNGNLNYNASVSTTPSLKFFQKLSFGVGHVYNDLCAAMWFSYTLLFLQAVLHMDSSTSGSMMLLGQVMDALATPVIGILADRWGSKRLWHLAGTALVIISFPMIFSRCFGCWMDINGDYILWWQPFYYALVIILFQCGWAIVQISHLAMIPALTESPKERSELTAIRYTASVCSGVTVYLITWGILHLDENTKTSIGPTDDYKFRDVALFLTSIGCLTSVIFHFGLRKQISLFSQPGRIIRSSNERQITNPLETDANNSNITTNYTQMNNGISNENSSILNIQKKNFMLSPLLYQVALLYVASRLFSALSLVYVPLYLDERLSSAESKETIESIASVPLVSYISSFFTSLLLKIRGSRINHKVLYTIGSAISIGACTWIASYLTPSSETYELYMIAALLGVGSSITMVTSLCITADLIGTHSDQGAIVYSIVTFADKLITGIAVILIENSKCENRTDCPDYYRRILAYVCGSSALFGILVLVIWETVSLKCAHASSEYRLIK